MPDIFISKKSGDEEKKKEKKSIFENPPPSHIAHLSSFYQNPLGIWFQGQEEDEEIILFLRSHFITNLPWIFLSVILIFTPFAFLFVFPALNGLLFNLSFISARFITIFIIFFYLVVLAYALVSFITWYYNIFIVTKKRVVDIDFSDLVYHNVALTKLNLVQDIDYNQVGFIRSLFNYGDVFIQTAGDKPNFDAKAVPKPAKVAQIIEDLIGKEEGNAP